MAKQNRFERMLKNSNPLFIKIGKISAIILIIILFLILLELGAGLLIWAVSLANGGDYDSRAFREVFDNKPWAKDFFKESKQISAGYVPYIGYQRTGPFTGEYINIDENGHRLTSNPCAGEPGELKVFMFGGSTMWGWGSTDKTTIASYVAKMLCEQGIVVNVTNYGESGYVSRQEVIALEQELLKGNIPDIVIYFDGVNDIYAAYQNNQVGLPQNMENREFEFGLRDRVNVFRPLLSTNTMKIVKKIFNPLIPLQPLEMDSINNKELLSSQILEQYVLNMQQVNMLGEQYGFSAYFFWQPSLFSKKKLSVEEASFDYVSKPFFEATYEKTEQYIQLGFYDISNVFDDHNESIFFDWVHTTSEGNKIIADAITQQIVSALHS